MDHRLKTLARTNNCKVDHCTCSAVHISVGGTTVRVDVQSARELRDAMIRALAEIDAPSVAAPTPAAHLVSVTDDEDDGGPKVH